MVSSFVWFFCRLKSSNSEKYNISIPTYCIEYDEFKNNNITTSDLGSGLKVEMYTSKNIYNNINSGVVIFFQIFYLSSLLICMVLLSIRFVQFNLLSKLKFEINRIIHIFYFIGKKKNLTDKYLLFIIVLLLII